MAEIEPATLSAKEIPFHPGNDTGHGVKTITINGVERSVHETNNLVVLFESFLSSAAGKTPSNPQELTYFHTLTGEDKIFPAIVRKLIEKHNWLFEKLTEITYERETEQKARQRIRERAAAKLPPLEEDGAASFPSDEKQHIRDYYLSQGFDAMVPIAKEIDPEYEAKNLCR